MHSGTQDHLRGPPSLALVDHTLLLRFATDDILRQEHHAVLNAKLRTGETEIAFAEPLNLLTRRCQNVFTKSELVHCYKLNLSDGTRLMLQNNIISFNQKIRHYLDRVTPSTTGKPPEHAKRRRSNTTGTTTHGRDQAVHHLPGNLSPHSFPPYPPSSISVSVTSPGDTQLSSISVSFRCPICRQLSSPTS